MVFSDEGKIFFYKKSLYLKTDEYPEKSWTKRGVNNLLKKLRDTDSHQTLPHNRLFFRATHIEKHITMPSYA